MATDEAAALEAAVARACAAWPGTRGDAVAFREVLATKLPDAASLERWVAGL